MKDVTKSALRERLDRLILEIYNFHKQPLPITSLEFLKVSLGFRGQQGGKWIERLWKEHEANENRLTLGSPYTTAAEITRYIRTLAARVTRHVKFRGEVQTNSGEKVSVEILIEFAVEIDGTITLRVFQNSLSEKFKWYENKIISVLRRALEEELGIKVSRRHLRRPHLAVIDHDMDVTYMKDSRSGFKTEIDFHASRKFPGVLTHNQIFEVLWVMPEKYWRRVYHECMPDGRMLVHIWLPSDASSFDAELYLEYIRLYMQARILRLSTGTMRILGYARQAIADRATS